jgi:glycosyltransferase involved in cell wall biosynthesis
MQFPAPSETFSCNNIRVLKKLGVDVSVYTLRPAHNKSIQMIKERNLRNIPITVCGIKENLAGIYYIFVSPVLFIELFFWLLKNDYNKPVHVIKCLLLFPASFYILNCLEREDPDVVHLLWGHYPSLVGHLVRKSMDSVKVSLFLGAYDLYRCTLGISADLAKDANYIFTLAGINIKQMKDMGIEPGRINVVYDGLDFAALSSGKGSLEKKVNMWSTAGRLIYAKGFHKVINILSCSIARQSEIRLLIAGDGPEKQNLIKLSKRLGVCDSIDFCGYLKQDKLFEIFVASDFFLLFSLNERLPNVVKEAMYAGCVCVVSYTPGIEELIIHGETGFIMKTDDYGQIANFILQVTPEEKRRIGKNARLFIEKNFDVEILMKKYISVWNS